MHQALLMTIFLCEMAFSYQIGRFSFHFPWLLWFLKDLPRHLSTLFQNCLIARMGMQEGGGGSQIVRYFIESPADQRQQYEDQNDCNLKLLKFSCKSFRGRVCCIVISNYDILQKILQSFRIYFRSLYRDEEERIYYKIDFNLTFWQYIQFKWQSNDNIGKNDTIWSKNKLGLNTEQANEKERQFQTQFVLRPNGVVLILSQLQ